MVFLWQKYHNDNFIIVLIYVDNMIVVGHNALRITKLNQELNKSFVIKETSTTYSSHADCPW